MAMPAPPPGRHVEPVLVATGTAQAIRDALLDEERADFERRFGEEMAEAARTLDMTGVLRVLREFRRIAEITQLQGAEGRRRTLDTAARLLRGEDVPTVPGHVHKAQIDARLGRLQRVLI